MPAESRVAYFSGLTLFMLSVAVKHLQIPQLSVVCEIHLCEVLQASLVLNVSNE